MLTVFQFFFLQPVNHGRWPTSIGAEWAFVIVERSCLGHLLISSQPDTDRGELNRSEGIVVALVVAGCDSPEALDLVEEPLYGQLVVATVPD